jgi:hypothetical protein
MTNNTAVNSHLKTVAEAAPNLRCGVPTPNKLRCGTSQGSSLSNAVIQLQPLALPPLAAAQFLSISKRSLSRLISAGKIVARKEGSRTLVDVESLKAYYAGLPVKR